MANMIEFSDEVEAEILHHGCMMYPPGTPPGANCYFEGRLGSKRPSLSQGILRALSDKVP